MKLDDETSDFELIKFKNFDYIKLDLSDLSKFTQVINNYKNYKFKTSRDQYIHIDEILEKNFQKDINLKINDNLDEKNILIPTQDFLEDLENSFINYNVEKQFQIDLNRCHFFINYIRTINFIEIKEYLLWKYGNNFTNKILMSCNQAIMGLPFQILQKIFTKENMFVSEIPNHKISNNLQIFINTYSDKVNIYVKKKLRAFNINDFQDAHNQYIINTILDFDIYTGYTKNNGTVLIKYKITPY